MKTINKQSTYIIKDENGKLSIFHYAPDQDLSGQKASDSYSLMMGLFIDNPSHELWIGDVVCHRNTPVAWGVSTKKDIICQIVAKQQYLWDMSKPIGRRQSDVKKTSNFDVLFASIIKQTATYSKPALKACAK